MKNILLFFLPVLFMEDVFGKTDEMVTVVKGDSVTLHTGLTKMASNDVLDWSFGENSDLIARLNTTTKKITSSDDVLYGRFSGRLKVDSQTGDLTIRNIKTTDTGIYEVESTYNKAKRFSVNVVSLDRNLSVLVGEFVTLQTGLPDTQGYDVIWWRFGPQRSPIAEVNIKDKTIFTLDGPDNLFKDVLQLTLTGSLTITNIKTKHSGLYEVDIIRKSSYTIHKTFNVNVTGEVETLSVSKGESVTLCTGTEMHIEDSMVWMFEDTLIVSQSNKHNLFLIDDPDGIFRDILILDYKTGSLKITDIKTEHAGSYKLQISSSRRTVYKKFIINVKDTRSSAGYITAICFAVVVVAAAVTVCNWFYYHHKIYEAKRHEKSMSVNVTDDVTLEPGITKTVKEGDVVLWNFEGVLIAAMHGQSIRIFDETFKGCLQPNGSLIIKDIQSNHAGLYQASVMMGRNASFSSFKVTVFDPTASRGNEDDAFIHENQWP